jgi:hypothetical protein
MCVIYVACSWYTPKNFSSLILLFLNTNLPLFTVYFMSLLISAFDFQIHLALSIWFPSILSRLGLFFSLDNYLDQLSYFFSLFPSIGKMAELV